MEFQGFAIHHRFNHWTEPSAVLLSNTLYPTMLCTNKHPECDKYVDPTGEEFRVFDQMEVTPEMRAVYIHQGDIHRQCSPEKQGKINAPHVKRQLVISHTTGMAPYDVYANLEYASLSDSEVKITNVMKKTQHDLIMEADFPEDCGFYERPTKKFILMSDMKEMLKKSVGEGQTKFLDLEPAEFWLDSVLKKKLRKRDSICVALNWCSIRTPKHCEYILNQLNSLRRAVGGIYDITLRLHSFDQGNKKIFSDAGFKLESGLSKFDSMDSYDNFLVDSTGFGLEAAHRGWGDRIRVFSIKSLCHNEEFGGLDQMGIYPTHSIQSLISEFEMRPEESNYPEWLMDSVFPSHQTSSILEFSNLYAKSLMKIASEG